MKTKVKFHGIDSFNRPVFKGDDKKFYGDVDNLFSRDAEEGDVLSKINSFNLVYFGRSFDCEPMGTSCDVEIIYN